MKYSLDQPKEFDFTPSLNIGLSEDQAKIRRKQGLTNKIKFPNNGNVFFILLKNIFCISNIFMLATMITLLVLGQYLSLLLLIVIVIKTALGLVNDLSSHHYFKKHKFTESEYKVVREKKIFTLPYQKIVLNDVVIISEGEVISFDAEVGEGTLQVDESFLTGKPSLVKKEAGDILYSGSKILNGKAFVRAKAVGRFSSQQKELERALTWKETVSSSKMFNNLISWISCGVALLVFLIALIVYSSQGTITSFETFKEQMTPILELIGVVLPCSLYLFSPIVYLVSSLKLKKHNVKCLRDYNLAAFASCDVVCFDKTNTLSTNRLSVKKIASLSPTLSQTDINQIVSDVLLATNDQNELTASLRRTFNYQLSKVVTKAYPYSADKGFFGASLKGGKTYLVGDIDKINLVNKQGLLKRSEEFTKEGYQVLVLAEASNTFNATSLENMSFNGVAFIVLAEEIRPEVIETIKWLLDNGKEIKIISGDNEIRCVDVALKLGLPLGNKAVSLKDVSNHVIGQIIDKYSIFANANSEQKAQIVNWLQKQKKKVVMVGDGDNDAFAMRCADLSITLARGTPLAKATADIVLQDNNIESLQALNEEGKVMDNKETLLVKMSFVKTIPLLVVGLGFVLVSAFSNIPAIRPPLTSSHYLPIELFYTFLGALFIVFDNNKRDLNGKFSKNTILYTIIPLLICLVAAIAVPFMFALQINKVMYTGFTYDSYDNIYVSTQMVTGTFVAIFLTLITTLWVLDYRRSVLLTIGRAIQSVAMILLIVIGYAGKVNLFGINFTKIEITVIYFPAIIALFALAAGLFIHLLVHIFDKGDEKEDVKDQPKD